MKPFLYNIASGYYKKYSDEVSEFTFVFPNRRSGIFFQRYLSQIAGKPIFSPKICTISDLFSGYTDTKVLDKTKLLFILYEVFREYNEESFDDFIYWGEILLNDFDDIDKYLADAKSLFTNIKDINQIESDFDFLDEEQIKVIQSFWKNFIPSFESEKKESFALYWSKLYDIYSGLRNRLSEEGFAYEGMMFRSVTEDFRKGNIERVKDKKIIFIGFNALTTVEREFMKILRDMGIADFYWDYESLWLKDKDNRASFFSRSNMRDFPSELNISDSETDCERDINVIGIPSAIGQTKYVAEILSDLIKNKEVSANRNYLDTAIVLSDENLLIPTLYSIPRNFDPINVTMGKNIRTTPIAGLIDYISELQRQANKHDKGFYHQTVTSILNHKYVISYDEETVSGIQKKIIDENLVYVDPEILKGNILLDAIFRTVNQVGGIAEYLLTILRIIQEPKTLKQGDEDNEIVTLSELDMEFVYHYYLTINRLTDIMNQYRNDISVISFFRLLKQMTESVSVPFSGEPLSGLQIMGVLETRVLDFDNVILVAANEGVFPKKSVATSFIPSNLRRGFRLSTTEHQDAIFAYHFYHMISRARNVYILYDTRTGGSGSGEVTRYVHQLKYHYGIDINEFNINYDIRVPSPVTLRIEKSESVIKKLEEYLTDGTRSFLSASTINTYINCPLAFYIKHVERIEESNAVVDNMEADVFGTIFHAVMEHVYEIKKNKAVTEEWLESIIKDDEKIRNLIKKEFVKEFFRNTVKEDQELTGYNLLIREVLLKYVKQVLRNDHKNTPFIYIDSEKSFRMRYSFDDNRKVNIKGSIDRVDMKDGNYRIIDYKTGSGKLDFSSMKQLFDVNEKDRPKAVMQTFLYCMMFHMMQEVKTISPHIFYLRNFFSGSINNTISVKPSRGEESALPVGAVTDFIVLENYFKRYFDKCISEIFDYSVPFEQTSNTDNCKYCELKIICKR